MRYCHWIHKKFRGENIKISFSKEDASKIADKLDIDFDKEKFTLDEFYKGINVELEHGTKFPQANVTNNDPILTGMIALAHLLEFPDYYTRLAVFEEAAKKYWNSQR